MVTDTSCIEWRQNAIKPRHPEGGKLVSSLSPYYMKVPPCHFFLLANHSKALKLLCGLSGLACQRMQTGGWNWKQVHVCFNTTWFCNGLLNCLYDRDVTSCGVNYNPLPESALFESFVRLLAPNLAASHRPSVRQRGVLTDRSGERVEAKPELCLQGMSPCCQRPLPHLITLWHEGVGGMFQHNILMNAVLHPPQQETAL